MERLDQNLKFESSKEEPFTVCFEPFCETFEIKADHILSVPVHGNLNDLSITIRDGEITVSESGDVLDLSKAKLQSTESVRQAAQLKYKNR